MKVIEAQPVIDAQPVLDGQAVFEAQPVLEAKPVSLRQTANHRVDPGPTELSWSPPRERAILSSPRSSPVVVLEEVDVPAARDPRLVVALDPDSEQARNYRLLRHRLIARSDPHVIAVTSAGAGEGKTTCAANLALAMAEESYARVLLIEANTQRPALAQAFGFKPADSFIARLIHERDAKPPYFVARVRNSRLHVAALQLDGVRGMRLDRLLLGLAISELRYVYQYIVIDAGSVFESADANVIAECSDGVIVTARARRSRRTALYRAIDQLSPTPVLGTVLLDT
jgi:Mrp family chromosome partitioning ATPase